MCKENRCKCIEMCETEEKAARDMQGVATLLKDFAATISEELAYENGKLYGWDDDGNVYRMYESMLSQVAANFASTIYTDVSMAIIGPLSDSMVNDVKVNVKAIQNKLKMETAVEECIQKVSNRHNRFERVESFFIECLDVVFDAVTITSDIFSVAKGYYKLNGWGDIEDKLLFYKDLNKVLRARDVDYSVVTIVSRGETVCAYRGIKII